MAKGFGAVLIPTEAGPGSTNSTLDHCGYEPGAAVEVGPQGGVAVLSGVGVGGVRGVPVSVPGEVAVDVGDGVGVDVDTSVGVTGVEVARPVSSRSRGLMTREAKHRPGQGA